MTEAGNLVMKLDHSVRGKRKYYIGFSLLFLFSLGCGLANSVTDRAAPDDEVVIAQVNASRTPWPTFTPSPTIDLTVLSPTETNTPPPMPTDTPLPPTPAETPPPPPTPTETPPPPAPQANINVNLNVRAGPGTAYNWIGQVPNGHNSTILGRNDDGSWIVINYSGGQGWVAASYATIEGDLNQVEVQQAGAPPPTSPPPPPPTATPVPPQAQAPQPPPGPSYPYKLTNVFGETNGAITQIRGYIKDSNGQPANGVRVRVRIGSFCTVSVPSGQPGVYPNGNYDVLLRPYASDGVWQVSIVDKPTDPTDFSCDNGATQLSEEVRVTTNTQEGVTYVEFQKQ